MNLYYLSYPDVVTFNASENLGTTPGEAKAKAMPGRLYIHTEINNNK